MSTCIASSTLPGTVRIILALVYNLLVVMHSLQKVYKNLFFIAQLFSPGMAAIPLHWVSSEGKHFESQWK